MTGQNIDYFVIRVQLSEAMNMQMRVMGNIAKAEGEALYKEKSFKVWPIEEMC